MGALRPFQYYEPGTVAEATQILLRHGAKAKVLAGGVNLVPSMRKYEIQPEFVVSLQKIPGLDYINYHKTNGLRIGALTRLRAIELSPEVPKNYPALYEAIHQISSLQAKSMGTVVGNLCVATPASDVATALFVLGAKLRIAGTTWERMVAIEDFYVGVQQTVLQSGEIVTEILVPSCTPKSGAAFLNLRRTAGDISKVSIATLVTVNPDTIKEARIALGAVAPTVIRARKAEEILKGQRTEKRVIEAAAEAAMVAATPIMDIRSTAEYRKEITGILVKRAIEKALARAKA